MILTKVSRRVKMAPRPIFQVFMPLVKNHWPLKESGMMMHLPFLQCQPLKIDEEEYQQFGSESDDVFFYGKFSSK